MMHYSQGQEGNTFRGWKLQSRDELQCMISDAMHSNGQKSGRWVHEDQSQHPCRGGTRKESFVKTLGRIMMVIRGRNVLG
jgi:hypothetical protein